MDDTTRRNQRVLLKIRALSMALTIVFGVSACVMSPVIEGPLHPPIQPRQVMIFEPPLVPQHYTVVAKLDASGYGGCSSNGVDQVILQRLLKEAAQLGANGLLLIPYGNTRSMGPGGPANGFCSGRPLAKAEAIYSH
jgi:hypothetical protein